MAKAAISPISFSLTRKFEELPLFTFVHNGQKFHTGLIDGEFTVEFDQSGAWIIGDVAISTDNGMTGANAEGRNVTLDADKDGQLYIVIHDALTERYAGSVEYWIMEELPRFNLIAA